MKQAKVLAAAEMKRLLAVIADERPGLADPAFLIVGLQPDQPFPETLSGLTYQL